MVTSTTDALTENGLTLYPELSSLSRLRYFFGQLITQRDLEAEQRYHLVLRRLMQREAFGTGTVAGLKVLREENGVSPPLGVFLQPGLAMDPDGRELLLESEECFDVAATPLPSAGAMLAGSTKDELAQAIQDAFQAPFHNSTDPGEELDALVEALTGCGLMTTAEQDAYDSGDITRIKELLQRIAQSPQPTLAPGQTLREWLFDQLVGITYVGLRYREVDDDPSPAVLDASCCGDASCFPSRAREGVYIVTSQEPFPEVEDPHGRFKLCLDADFFEQMQTTPDALQVSCKLALCDCLTDASAWRGLPVFDPCGGMTPHVVCLASVCWSRYENDPDDQILSVDNCGCRLLAPGGPMLRALVESLTGCAKPMALPPRLVAISPTDGSDVLQSETDPLVIEGTVNAALTSQSPATSGWEILFYPEAGGDVQFFDGASGPQGSTAALTVDGSGSETRVALEFSTPTAAWETGTYVWRLKNNTTPPITADANGQTLDGEPNPPDAVPSGNGIAGGVFEARFIVKADPA